MCGYLYIPLCFLLIREPCWIMRRHSGLYIPLCFLLIYQRLNCKTGVTAFTFHYVFYESDLDRIESNTAKTLHSTMFSINLSCMRSFTGFCVLYIPLCFLLIRIPERTRQRHWAPLHSTMFSINQSAFFTSEQCLQIFTFHYVFY